MTGYTVKHSLSRPIWVDLDSGHGWMQICACGGWRSEPTGILKQLKRQGSEHLNQSRQPSVA